MSKYINIGRSVLKNSNKSLNRINQINNISKNTNRSFYETKVLHLLSI